MSPRKEGILLVLLTALGGGLAFFHLGRQGFAWVETFTVYMSLDWDRMLDLMRHSEANMWLYNFLTYFWLKLGTSEATVRSLPALCAILAIPLFFLLARKLFELRVAATATLLLVLNVFFLRYAQDARAYSLLLMLALLDSYLFLRAIEKPTYGAWIGYALAVVLTIYAHLLGGLLLFAHGASLLFLPRKETPWKKIVSALCVGVLGLIPLGWANLGAGQITWMYPVHASALVEIFLRFSGYNRPSAILFAVLLSAGFWSVYRGLPPLRRSRELWRSLFVTLWLIVPVAVSFAFSVWVRPITLPKYVMVSFAPFVLLAGRGLASFRKGWFAAAACAAVVISCATLHTYYTKERKQDWREATAYTLAHAREREAVILFSYRSWIAYSYYAERAPGGVHPKLVEIAGGPYNPGWYGSFPEPDLSLLRNLHRSYDAVWLFLWYDEGSPLGHERISQTIQSALKAQYRYRTEKEFLEVRLQRYGASPLAE
jgi:mannosyltransferase